MFYLEEFIGLIILRCSGCGEKFVVNSEAIKTGCGVGCKCGRYQFFAGQVGLTLKEVTKTNIEYPNAMPLEDYKKAIVDFIVNGKKFKPKKNQAVPPILDTDEEQINNTIEALIRLGYQRADAISKVQIALKEGLRMEEEILRYILSLKNKAQLEEEAREKARQAEEERRTEEAKRAEDIRRLEELKRTATLSDLLSLEKHLKKARQEGDQWDTEYELRTLETIIRAGKEWDAMHAKKLRQAELEKREKLVKWVEEARQV